MKKQAKKITLNRETLRNLDGKPLEDAVGGSGRWTCLTSCQVSQESCAATCDTCTPC